MRPGIYRGVRFGDGLALLAVAAALVVAVPAGAAHTEAKPAADPSVGGDDVVFQRPNGSGVLHRGGRDDRPARRRSRARRRPDRGDRRRQRSVLLGART